MSHPLPRSLSGFSFAPWLGSPRDIGNHLHLGSFEPTATPLTTIVTVTSQTRYKQSNHRTAQQQEAKIAR